MTSLTTEHFYETLRQWVQIFHPNESIYVNIDARTGVARLYLNGDLLVISLTMLILWDKLELDLNREIKGAIMRDPLSAQVFEYFQQWKLLTETAFAQLHLFADGSGSIIDNNKRQIVEFYSLEDGQKKLKALVNKEQSNLRLQDAVEQSLTLIKDEFRFGRFDAGTAACSFSTPFKTLRIQITVEDRDV